MSLLGDTFGSWVDRALARLWKREERRLDAEDKREDVVAERVAEDRGLDDELAARLAAGGAIDNPRAPHELAFRGGATNHGKRGA